MTRHVSTVARQARDAVTQVQPRRRGVNPFANLADNLCSVRQIFVSDLKKLPNSVRIALVSMPPFNSVEWDVWDNREETETLPRSVRMDLKRQLVFLKESAKKNRLAAYKDALIRAVDDVRANIVCVSELGLPHTDSGPLREATRFAKKLCEEKRVMIIAGTGHDKRTKFNTGYVYHPGGKGWAFHKVVSAIGTDELIASPSERRVLTIKTFGIRVATMICLDIADYATLASVIRVKDRVDVVLIPCHTQKFDKMADIATIASKALRGVVAMVNARVPNRICRIARFGEELEPTQTSCESGALISHFDLNYEELERRRITTQNQRDDDVDWLFGSGDLPLFA